MVHAAGIAHAGRDRPGIGIWPGAAAGAGLDKCWGPGAGRWTADGDAGNWINRQRARGQGAAAALAVGDDHAVIARHTRAEMVGVTGIGHTSRHRPGIAIIPGTSAD